MSDKEHTQEGPGAPSARHTPSAEDGEVEEYHDAEVEKRLLHKFDKYVLPQFMIMVLIGYLDRSNIGRAKSLLLIKEPL
jgi:hypothetical protein